MVAERRTRGAGRFFCPARREREREERAQDRRRAGRLVCGHCARHRPCVARGTTPHYRMRSTLYDRPLDAGHAAHDAARTRREPGGPCDAQDTPKSHPTSFASLPLALLPPAPTTGPDLRVPTTRILLLCNYKGRETHDLLERRRPYALVGPGRSFAEPRVPVQSPPGVQALPSLSHHAPAPSKKIKLDFGMLPEPVRGGYTPGPARWGRRDL